MESTWSVLACCLSPIGSARNYNVGKYKSCMVSKLPMIYIYGKRALCVSHQTLFLRVENIVLLAVRHRAACSVYHQPQLDLRATDMVRCTTTTRTAHSSDTTQQTVARRIAAAQLRRPRRIIAHPSAFCLRETLVKVIQLSLHT